jgi:spore cortex biosynthesis protein YabQ
MYEPVAVQNLQAVISFAVLGFFLGALYEPLRVIRLFFKHGAVAVGVQDFLFLAASGIIVFAYSLEFGEGYFRYFYLLGLAFGGVVYFLTVGKLINVVMRVFADAIRAAVHAVAKFMHSKIFVPVWTLFTKIAHKIGGIFVGLHKVAEKCRLLLQSSLQMRYNSMRDNREKAKEGKRHAQETARPVNTTIKARVTRVTRV